MKWILCSLVLLTLCSCTAEFEGVWGSVSNDEDFIVVRRPDQAEEQLWAVSSDIQVWQSCQKVNGRTYAGSRLQLERKGDELIVTDKHNAETPVKTYRLMPEKRLAMRPWLTYQQMPADFPRQYIADPDTIVKTAAGAEKWFYSGDLALIFAEEKLIKVRENYRLNRNYALVWRGMDRETVLRVLGTPDRKSVMNGKWSYGLEAELIFEEDVLTEVRLLDAAREIAAANAARNATEVNLRDKVLPLINQQSWYEQDAKLVGDYYQGVAAAGPGGQAGTVVGAFTKGKSPLINFPMLTLFTSYLNTSAPTTEQLARAVGAIDLTMKDIQQNSLLRSEVEAFAMQKPVYSEEKDLILIRSKGKNNSGQEVNIFQAMFVRGRQINVIQLSFASGQEQSTTEEFQAILEEIEL